MNPFRYLMPAFGNKAKAEKGLEITFGSTSRLIKSLKRIMKLVRASLEEEQKSIVQEQEAERYLNAEAVRYALENFIKALVKEKKLLLKGVHNANVVQYRLEHGLEHIKKSLEHLKNDDNQTTELINSIVETIDKLRSIVKTEKRMARSTYKDIDQIWGKKRGSLMFRYRRIISLVKKAKAEEGHIEKFQKKIEDIIDKLGSKKEKAHANTYLKELKEDLSKYENDLILEFKLLATIEEFFLTLQMEANDTNQHERDVLLKLRQEGFPKSINEEIEKHFKEFDELDEQEKKQFFESRAAA